MLVLPLQWEKHTGPDAVGQHKLVFTMDESVNHGEFNPMTIKKGTQFLVMLVEANSSEMTELSSETKDDTLKRFRNQMHALLGDIATINKTTVEIEKETMKSKLIGEGIIQKSTTELDINTLAAVIIRLKKYKNEITKD